MRTVDILVPIECLEDVVKNVVQYNTKITVIFPYAPWALFLGQ